MGSECQSDHGHIRTKSERHPSHPVLPNTYSNLSYYPVTASFINASILFSALYPDTLFALVL